jgi:hypothetical protein
MRWRCICGLYWRACALEHAPWSRLEVQGLLSLVRSNRAPRRNRLVEDSMGFCAFDMQMSCGDWVRGEPSRRLPCGADELSSC